MKPSSKPCPFCGEMRTPYYYAAKSQWKFLCLPCRSNKRKLKIFNRESQKGRFLTSLGYTGKSCAYIRQTNVGYYIGVTNNLIERYPIEQLYEIIYFEEYKTPQEAKTRERELIEEFIGAGIPLVNKYKTVE